MHSTRILKTAYGIAFDIRVGIHYGEVASGSVGAVGHERTTAIWRRPSICESNRVRQQDRRYAIAGSEAFILKPARDCGSGDR